MKNTSESMSRRDVLRTGVLMPAGLYATYAQKPASRTPPPYTLSINIEIMFRAQNLSKADRIRAVAAQGFRAYSFWSATDDERKAMLQAQQQTRLTCVSMVGTGPAGGSTGFTRPIAVTSTPRWARRARHGGGEADGGRELNKTAL